ncbi:MAG: hypothetical protein IT584_01545 [Chlamydiae bacterium]|nr:hypothetical protein [Chlamydiota bacterium]
MSSSFQPIQSSCEVLVTFQQQILEGKTPKLVLRGEGENRHLELVERLSLFEWIFAFFGFGDAALGNIARFVVDQKIDPEGVDKLTRVALRILGTKIIKHNAHSIFQIDVSPIMMGITPVSLPKGAYGGDISSTAPPHAIEPGDTLNTLDERGNYKYPHILDRIIMRPDKGLFVLMDPTGHHEVRVNRCKNTEKVYQEVCALVHEARQPATIQEAMDILREIVRLADDCATTNGLASTILINWLVLGDDKQDYLVQAALGDSDIFLMCSKSNQIEQLTPHFLAGQIHAASYRQGELCGDWQRVLVQFTPVNPEDKILMASDGISATMSLAAITIRVKQNAPENICSALTETITKTESLAPEERAKALLPGYEKLPGTENKYIPKEENCQNPHR